MVTRCFERIETGLEEEAPAYSNKKYTSKKKSTSVSEVAITYLHKNVIIPLLRFVNVDCL